MCSFEGCKGRCKECCKRSECAPGIIEVDASRIRTHMKGNVGWMGKLGEKIILESGPKARELREIERERWYCRHFVGALAKIDEERAGGG